MFHGIMENRKCFKKHYIHFSIYHADVATPPLDGGLCNSCATASISYQGCKSQPPGLPSLIHCFITAADKASHPWVYLVISSCVYTPPPYHCKSSLDPRYSSINTTNSIKISIKIEGNVSCPHSPLQLSKVCYSCFVIILGDIISSFLEIPQHLSI